MSVLTEVADRLATRELERGAFTPVELFGTDLAASCGGELLLDPVPAADPPTHAALVLSTRSGPLQIRQRGTPSPGAHEVLIRARAVAVNPIDVLPGFARRIVLPWLTYPAVLGSDVAGEVVEVGPGVTRFRVGQRVLGFAVGSERSWNRPDGGAFQEQVVLMDTLTSPIPDDLDVTAAAVLPLGLSTAACGLFQDDQLGLRLPTVDAAGSGEVVLVWGASTSVGSSAVQLARNAGYAVLATASARNHAYLRSLGAEAVVDYRSPDAARDLLAALGNRSLAGTLAIGKGSLGPCLTVARKAAGGWRRRRRPR